MLAAHEARYLVVGGYAVAYHGHPRYTGDINVWIECSSENAVRVVQALRDFGFGDLGGDEATLSAPDVVVQLGFPPNRIDLLTGVEGVTFEEAYPDREVLHLDELAIPIVGL